MRLPLRADQCGKRMQRQQKKNRQPLLEDNIKCLIPDKGLPQMITEILANQLAIEKDVCLSRLPFAQRSNDTVTICGVKERLHSFLATSQCNELLVIYN